MVTPWYNGSFNDRKSLLAFNSCKRYGIFLFTPDAASHNVRSKVCCSGIYCCEVVTRGFCFEQSGVSRNGVLIKRLYLTVKKSKKCFKLLQNYKKIGQNESYFNTDKELKVSDQEYKSLFCSFHCEVDKKWQNLIFF